jgi:futalosine hydrolase
MLSGAGDPAPFFYFKFSRNFGTYIKKEMNILLVSATFREIKFIYEKLKQIEKKDDFFSRHQLNKNQADILITGVGIASTAYQLGKTLNSNKYNYAINLGIAGSFKPSLIPGTVVNVETDLISEMGAENGDSFLKFNELKLSKNIINKSIWSIRNKNKISNAGLLGIPKVKGITVNTVHGNKRSIEEIIRLYHPDIETMEGAVFLHICNTEKIKCAQIRSISNFIEERNLDHWETDLAIKNLNDAALKILNTLC